MSEFEMAELALKRQMMILTKLSKNGGEAEAETLYNLMGQEFKNIDRFNAAIKFALCMRRIARKTVRGKPISYMMTTVGLNDLKKYGVTE
jgi:hypothetical protein